MIQLSALPLTGGSIATTASGRRARALLNPSERLASRLFSLETVLGVLLAVYLLVGRWSPVRLAGQDATVLAEARVWVTGALLILFAVCVSRRPLISGRATSPLFVPALLFVAYMVLSFAWTPEPSQALPKVLDLVVLFLVTSCATALVRRSKPDDLAVAFWLTVALIAGVNAFAVISADVPMFNAQNRVTPLGGGPNVFARIMGLMCIAALYFGQRTRVWLVWSAVAALSVLLVVTSGSRGGLLSLIVALLVAFLVYLFQPSTKRVRTLVASVVLVGCFGALITITSLGGDALDTFDRRVRRLTIEDRYDSGRSMIFQSAIDMGRRYPVAGGGLDAFQVSEPHGFYQHNVFLEAFSEGGIIGLGLLAWLIVAALRRSIRPSSVESVAYAAAFFLILVSSQVSGDLYDSRALFLLPVLIGAAQYGHRAPSKP